jgi:serine/threonine-protein kinase
MQAEQLLNDRYRLADVIGMGGMSVVWRAHDEILNRTVAVKVLDWPEADEQVRQRMLAEARAAALLSHPNITNVYDYGEAGGIPFVVMELLTGRSLAEELALGPLEPRAGLTIGAQVASAVAAAHEHGLVHRDIKPTNVVLTPGGAKVLDFGIAAFAGSPDVDTDGIVLGTPTYLAPERMLADTVTPSVDVFALGVLMYRLLTRELPWSAGSPSEMIKAHETVEPKPLRPLPGVPASVNAVCRRCLDKDPDRRPSAAEVADVLAAAAALTPPSGVVRRRRTALVAACCTGAVLLGLPVVLPILRPATSGGVAAAPAVQTPTVAGTRTDTGAPSSSGPASGGPTQSAGGEPVALPPIGPGSPAATAAPTPTATQPPRTGPPPPPPPPPPSATAEAVSAVGGTVYIACNGDKATIVSIEPAPGFTVQQSQPGPDRHVRVLFASADMLSQIDAHCDRTGLVPTVKNTPIH